MKENIYYLLHDDNTITSTNNHIAFAKNKHEKWKIRQEYVVVKGHKFFVSTVWLGIDHSFRGGPPLLFETMVFEERDISSEPSFDVEVDCVRYHSYQDAIDGHQKMITKVKNKEYIKEIK